MSDLKKKSWNFLDRFSKKNIWNFIKIRTVGAELFHADGQMDRYDEANSRFLQSASAPSNEKHFFDTTFWQKVCP